MCEKKRRVVRGGGERVRGEARARIGSITTKGERGGGGE